MKYLKKINEFFGEYDNFDEISPEQAYQELEKDMDLPNQDDIKDEVDFIFEFMEKDGLNPYEMTFDDFYKWASENFKLEYPKSFYENSFKNKVNPINKGQLELGFNESEKIKSFNNYIKESIFDSFLSNIDYNQMLPDFTQDIIDKVPIADIHHLLVELNIGHYLYNENHLKMFKEKLEKSLIDNDYTKSEQQILSIKKCLKQIENLAHKLK